MSKRNYSMLVDEVEVIKATSNDITSEQLMQTLSERGWKLSHYKEIFFDVQDMKNFFRI